MIGLLLFCMIVAPLHGALVDRSSADSEYMGQPRHSAVLLCGSSSSLLSGMAVGRTCGVFFFFIPSVPLYQATLWGCSGCNAQRITDT